MRAPRRGPPAKARAQQFAGGLGKAQWACRRGSTTRAWHAVEDEAVRRVHNADRVAETVLTRIAATVRREAAAAPRALRLFPWNAPTGRPSGRPSAPVKAGPTLRGQFPEASRGGWVFMRITGERWRSTLCLGRRVGSQSHCRWFIATSGLRPIGRLVPSVPRPRRATRRALPTMAEERQI